MGRLKKQKQAAAARIRDQKKRNRRKRLESIGRALRVAALRRRAGALEV